MKEFDWLLCYGNENTDKKAVEILIDCFKKESDKNITPILTKEVTEKQLQDYNLIFLGKKDENLFINKLIDDKFIDSTSKSEQYSFATGNNKWNNDRKMIAITGFDYNGLLYGVVDFINIYVKEYMPSHYGCRFENPDIYHSAFTVAMLPYKRTSSPSIKERGNWSWGHCIYNYKKYFDNMLLSKLNAIVIWNDFVPLNGKEIVDYAHQCGIKLFWGFSWGWENKGAIVDNFSSPEIMDKWQKNIAENYLKNYMPTGADGIYFQTFTERLVNKIDGNIVAKLVCKWVNYIAEGIYKIDKNIRIQFGLHATSVKNDIKYLKCINKNMDIIWEDCGSFPFDYFPSHIDGYNETTKFMLNVSTLRSKNDNFGVVLKGFSVLNWEKFKHQTESSVLGNESDKFILNKEKVKSIQWRLTQSCWLKNGKYALDLFKKINKKRNGNYCAYMLVEDAPFENKLWFPVAYMAEILWDLSSDISDILYRVSNSDRVYFANNSL